MFVNFEMSLSWSDLIKRTAHETVKDDAQGLASQLAYYFFLALFPALLCVIAIASFFPLQHFTDTVVTTLGPFAPKEMIDIIQQEMTKIGEGQNGGLLTIGILGAIWSSSAAIVSLIGTMNRAYDIDESRPWWKVRLIAIGLTLALAVFVVVAFTLIVLGPQLADFLAARLAFGQIFVWTWKVVQWPLAFFLVAMAIGLVYYFAPDAEQSWVWITPGSLVATALWFVASLAFRYYTVNFGHYEATYGAIGGVILLLLWFYISGLVIVIGAEMNAELEHAAPWGKAPGEKVPGEKKKIGVAAARAYHGQLPPPPAKQPVRKALPPYESPGMLARLTAAIIVVLRWRSRNKVH